MSSEVVERPSTLALEGRMERRVHFSGVEAKHIITSHHATTTPSPRKPRQDIEYRYKRKRSYSFSGPGDFRASFKKRKNNIVLPSKFLLGGTISDPLNLGSLDKEGIRKLGDESGPGSVSRRSDAVRVIIPPNINDPLNLDASSDTEDTLTDALQKQLRRKRRRGKRKRRLSEPGGGSGTGELLDNLTDLKPLERCSGELAKPNPESTVVASVLPVEVTKPLTVNIEFTSPQNTSESRRDAAGPVTPTGTKPSVSGALRCMVKKQRAKVDNKIVSPVIPQPGVDRKRHPSHNRHSLDKPHLSQQNVMPPKSFNPKNEHFQYGNYNKYYGYRNPDHTPDSRLNLFKRDWFEGKEVLDIGCNIGHITLTIARDFNPKRVVGIDIDKKLVNIAEKNIKHYMRKGDVEEANFPKSMRLLYGPLKPSMRPDGSRTFPYNVKFVHGNYVLESDELLETVRPEFDLILCLSVTKWIHLNWGDAGLKRFFRRMFHNLRPGGRLVLEPQGWPSYNKRRKLTKKIFENYKNIRLFPEKFNDFLLHDVGFSTSEKMATPHHTSHGFQRPIIVYTKGGGNIKTSPAYSDPHKETTENLEIPVVSKTEEEALQSTCVKKEPQANEPNSCEASSYRQHVQDKDTKPLAECPTSSLLDCDYHACDKTVFSSADDGQNINTTHSQSPAQFKDSSVSSNVKNRTNLPQETTNVMEMDTIKNEGNISSLVSEKGGCEEDDEITLREPCGASCAAVISEGSSSEQSSKEPGIATVILQNANKNKSLCNNEKVENSELNDVNNRANDSTVPDSSELGTPCTNTSSGKRKAVSTLENYEIKNKHFRMENE